MSTSKVLRTTIFVLLVIIFAAGSIVTARPALAAAENQSDTSEGVVIASKLNFREGASLTSDVIKILDFGQKVTILSTSSDGLWLKVKLPSGEEGWVYKLYIQTGVVQSTTGTVIVDELILRAGPGKSYRNLATLKMNESLSVSGRDAYGDWLLVHTKSGLDGWVFSPYVVTGAAVSSLPVREGYGGPDGSPSSSKPLSIVVTIRDNQAVVDLRGYPANAKVAVTLAPAGEKANLKVASGTTDANGSAQLTFGMPSAWSDGTKLTSGSLSLVAAVEDGSFSRTATVLYYK